MSDSQPLVSNNIIQSVFKIITQGGSGTSFFYSDNRYFYLITAKHMFPLNKSGDSVSIDIVKKQ
jgi:hypothetical protein